MNRAYRLTTLVAGLQRRAHAYLAGRRETDLSAGEAAIQTLITGLQRSAKTLSARLRQTRKNQEFDEVQGSLKELELIITAEKGIFGMHREALASSARAEGLRASLARAERDYEHEVNRVDEVAHILNETAQIQAERDVRHARWGVAGGLAGGAILALVLGIWFARRVVEREELVKQQQREHARVQQQNVRFDLALTSMSHGLCMFDEQKKLLVMNERYANMYALPAGLRQPGTCFSSMIAHEAAVSGRGSELCEQFYRDPDGLLAFRQKVAFVHELADGRAIQVLIAPIVGGGWICTHEDVTERKRSEAQIIHMAHHDALTGLPNRVLLREHLERVLPQMDHGQRLAVLCLDLDGFKTVNDTHGHPAGDELLRAVARRLENNVRKNDLIARLGGDEFAIVQAEGEQPLNAASISSRLVEVLKQPFEVFGHKVEIGTSIGVALADAQSAVIDELLRSADIALYRAKAEGRGTFRFFEPDMDVDIQRRRAIEADLRAAVANEQFEVHYQPLVDAETELLSGFEALVRWRHPERGLVAPGDFIGLAEEIGLIRSLGAWVLTRACADAVSWPEHIKIAVNLSPVQITSGGLCQEVRRALDISGLDPQRLELEITESVLLQNSEATLEVLHQLRKLGVSIAMDDFGTGYSSLSYLRRFPFDKIKIDQSFVRHMDEDSLEIIRAVVGLGKALKMQVLAEGVESVQQLDTLQDEGCDQLQGYLFSRPRPAAELAEIIASWPSSSKRIRNTSEEGHQLAD